MDAEQEQEQGSTTSSSADPVATSPPRAARPTLSGEEKPFSTKPTVNFANDLKSPTSALDGQLSPQAADRVFPIRSVVSVDPTPTPSQRPERMDGYFPSAGHSRRQSSYIYEPPAQNPRPRRSSEVQSPPPTGQNEAERSRQSSTSTNIESTQSSQRLGRQPIQDIINETESVSSGQGGRSRNASERPISIRTQSIRSTQNEETEGLLTARFKHVVTDEGHAVITGRDGDVLQRCEDEPIHIPGAVQGFGLLIAFEEQAEGKLVVRVVSENSKQMVGYTPKQLFALDSFTDILSEEQADNLLDHVDFIRDEDADVLTNGPEVFTMSIRPPSRKSSKFWCAMHINERHPNLIICEFELEDDPVNPLVPPNDQTPEPPEDTLDSRPTDEEFQESTSNASKPLRVLRSARKRKGEQAAMEVFNIMSQVQEQLASAPNLDKFLKILVGVVKELTGFHRVMIYQFDQAWNGRVVTELVDPRATKDLYKGLNFPASDIPKQARDLYKINKVRMLYDRDQETARLVCRTVEDLETPLDMTFSFLRAMSPIHIKYLANMAVRSSMSISINAFDELWGLIACHSYGSKGMRVSFPIRKMCRLVGDSASRNIERLSYASRLQARKLINTVPTQSNPSGYIIASSEDLLKLFDADFGLLSIREETKILGRLEQSQEALAMLEYLRMRRVTSVMTSMNIKEDFPDLRYPPGFSVIAGLLIVPLSAGGEDFIVFFRKGQLKEVKWAGNPYEKFIKEGTEGYLEPRKSFKTWSEMIVGRSKEWTEEEIETAAVLCLVYGKFIEVWRQKEAALQNSQLTRLLLANSAHEVRTPLNAIINYLEIAMESSLDQETRDNLAKSHSASKSLIYVINDLLDLTKTEEGVELVKDEVFDINAMLAEATDPFKGDAKRKNIEYGVSYSPGCPSTVVGDQRRVRQAISNVTANAIQNTKEGSVRIEMYLASREGCRCEIEVSIADTGVGMSTKKLDQLFRELEQVQTEGDSSSQQAALSGNRALLEDSKEGEERTLGLGLAVVARIIRNMNGQLRLKSEEGRGSKFVMQFPFDLPDTQPEQAAIEVEPNLNNPDPQSFGEEKPSTPIEGEVTLIERGSASKRSFDDKRPVSVSSNTVTRKNSGDSLNSRRSIYSTASTHSGKSEADRLIEAIQEPHRVEGWHPSNVARSSSKRLGSSQSADNWQRPKLEKRHTHTAGSVNADGSPTSSRPKSLELGSLQSGTIGSEVAPIERQKEPGQMLVTDQGVPIRPVRITDDELVSSSPPKSIPPAQSSPRPPSSQSPFTPVKADPASDDHLRVLVAEDDPVNSRIIKKRLEKMGHHVMLTVNGEDCLSAYCERSGVYDIVLMDMQMPILDGLSATKMIRSHEKTHPDHQLSPRASNNGRVPIIAVSASLVEKERQKYIDFGFDGWILKPISFTRLAELMRGIVDRQTRQENLYRAGAWEHGGWFHEALEDAFSTDTKPSGEPPKMAPGASQPSEGLWNAAMSDDPFVKEEMNSEQSREQKRLAQVDGAPGLPQKSFTMPELAREGSSEETITPAKPDENS